jgi:hypothetical protein
MNTQKIKDGHIYRHYKGSLYKVIKIAYNTEGKVLEKESDIDDSVKLVVYTSLENNPALGENIWWVRPYTMFTESIIIDGKEQPRFAEVETDENECSLCKVNPEMAAYVKRANDPQKER